MKRADRWLSPNLRDMLAVYLVADPEQTDRDLFADVAAALEGGLTCVQLRAKNLPDAEAWHLAMRLRELCRSHRAMFLVNDRLDVALAAQTDGVHLGVDDLPPWICRWITGDDFVIGYSPASDYGTHLGRGADYLGVGPVFETRSKPDAGEALGLDGFVRRIEYAEEPVVAIGGITAENAASVIQKGATGVAVVSAILRATDPSAAAAALADSVMKAKG